MTDRPLRMAIWAAVSSKAQAGEDKVSLEEQERQGQKFAEDVSGEVVATYQVPGHTRDLIFYTDAEAAMPAYKQLRQGVEKGSFDVLWALDVDRLGRDPALSQQVISLVEKGGAEVYLASAPHQLGQKTVGHRYISAIQSVRAGEDQALRVHRHRSGMKGRVQKRGLLPSKTPFYLTAVRDAVTGQTTHYEFSDRVGALDLMTELFLAGHSYAEIRRRLDDSPYPPPGNGRCWWHRPVWEILRSDVPAGYAHWGSYRSPGPSDKIPARWDPATHEAIIAERQRRARSGYVRQGAGPLTRVVICNRCGANMTRERSGNKKVVYVRCGRHAAKAMYEFWTCHPNYIREDAVLREVAIFLETLTTPQALDKVLARRGDGEEHRQLQEELARAQATTEDLERRRTRIAHAFAGGEMDVTMYRQVDDDLLDQFGAQQARIIELEQMLGALPDMEARRAVLEELVRDWEEVLQEEEPARVARRLQMAGIRVLVEEGRVVEIGLG